MKTRFGEYGGQYVPEVLMNEVNKVAQAFEECKKDREFQDELHRLFVNYTGRPSMKQKTWKKTWAAPASS